MFEVAQNSSGMLEGRKPMATEARARELAQSLASQRNESFQVWGPTKLLDVIDPAPAHPAGHTRSPTMR